MTAAENLKRWRETEQDATAGPWEYDLDGDIQGRRPGMSSDPEMDAIVGQLDRDQDNDFIMAAREAMPALLAFAEAVFTLAERLEGLTDPVIPERMVHRLADQHLGGAS